MQQLSLYYLPESKWASQIGHVERISDYRNIIEIYIIEI